MGLLIFFDDYANCMLVGSTMRPRTDRLRISREKLAYIVDSTAAPIAGISLLSTWVAFEVSVFSAQLPEVGISQSGYAIFLQALPYRYYCWFTLLFVALTIASGRDFGPMARAEQRARSQGLLVRPGGRTPISEQLSTMVPAPQMPGDPWIAALPVAATLLVTVLRIFADGDGFAVLELRGGTHLVLLQSEEAGAGSAPFDLMVEDLDDTHRELSERGLSPSEISRGKIHDSFQVRDPSGLDVTFNSSHVSDLPV